MIPVVVAIAVVVTAGCAVAAQQRRHGSAFRGDVRRRSGRDISREAMHSRIDIDAVPYEPARHAGQRDWATYRARDRHRD